MLPLLILGSVAVTLAAFGALGSAQAQCTGVCGDVDGYGSANSADVVKLTRYAVRASDTDLVSRDCANVDGYAGLTMRDLCYLVDHVFWAESVDCMIDSPAYVPSADSVATLQFNHLIPPGDTSVFLHFDAQFAFRAAGLAFCARVLVDSQPAQFGTVSSEAVNTDWWDHFAFGDLRTAVIPPGHLMGGYADYNFGVAGGTHRLGRAELRMPASPSYRTVTLEFVEVPPGDNAPMAVKFISKAAYALVLAPRIVVLTGDFNNDRELSSADLIGTVSFVFKGGRIPYPVPAAADTNCDGAVTSSDIIRLVNHIFKSGQAPCDVEVECTLNLDQWTCP